MITNLKKIKPQHARTGFSLFKQLVPCGCVSKAVFMRLPVADHCRSSRHAARLWHWRPVIQHCHELRRAGCDVHGWRFRASIEARRKKKGKGKKKKKKNLVHRCKAAAFRPCFFFPSHSSYFFFLHKGKMRENKTNV